ncbi:MAG TPA: AAA family ATPase [Pyrinomonadaceae bacterium]|jgi:predicted ATPase|nr:AAA family ATPase [Pyrinomonadaceae bacterium]
MLRTLAVANYRSLRNLIVPLQRLNLITGPNGSGKSSVYRALRLLADTAQGGVIPSLAREGGLPSTLWAGPESLGRAVKRGEHKVEGTIRKERTNLRLGFAGDEFGYAIDLGLPSPSRSAFALDPEIKTETIWAGPVLRPAALLVERHAAVVRSRNSEGDWDVLAYELSSFDSMLTQFADPRNAPEMLRLREQIRSWRFYDHFRTDVDAPARLPQIGTHTPVLSNDGADMAAALQTILEIGDPEALAEAVDDAFPKSSIEVLNLEGRFEIAMHQHGLLRPLRAAELSDGTLRYLLWIAALLTPRPPELLVLNEPETSLHPDLLPPLGRLIASAAERSQVLVVTHAAKLIEALEEQDDCNSVRLEKEFGETKVVGAGALDLPVWRWASR